MSAGTPLARLLPNFTDSTEQGTAATRLAALDATTTAEAAARVAAADQARLDAARTEGYQAGHAAGGGDAAAAFTALTSAMDQSAAGVRAATAQQVAADAETILACAMELAGWVIQRELRTDPEVFLPAVHQVLTDLPAAVAVTVTVHPQVHALYQRYATEDATREVHVATDPALPVGEAVVTTTDGGVARVGATAALRRALAAVASTGTLDAGAA